MISRCEINNPPFYANQKERHWISKIYVFLSFQMLSRVTHTFLCGVCLRYDNSIHVDESAILEK